MAKRLQNSMSEKGRSGGYTQSSGNRAESRRGDYGGSSRVTVDRWRAKAGRRAELIPCSIYAAAVCQRMVCGGGDSPHRSRPATRDKNR